ncbi:MAG: response regulator [Bacteroidetes bacterium]|nr:MAG: response regulator [Bacteroidota bacterium]
MKHIIVAEDDPGIRDIFKIILERAGYEVTSYSNGETLMENNFTAPHIFILDKQLPGIDGLEVCRFLKSQESTKNIPVIVVSASPYISGLSSNAGADDFIEKPFKGKFLIELIEKHTKKKDAAQ